MGTRHQGPALEIRALDAYIKLQRAADAVSTRVLAVLPATLTASQFGVLEVLYHLGPLCQSELADKLRKSGGNLTLVVDNLERAGLVRRERTGTDRRFVLVRLTTPGQEAITQVYPRIVAAVSAEMHRLEPDELRQFDRLCRKVGLPATAPAPAA